MITVIILQLLLLLHVRLPDVPRAHQSGSKPVRGGANERARQGKASKRLQATCCAYFIDALIHCFIGALKALGALAQAKARTLMIITIIIMTITIIIIIVIVIIMIIMTITIIIMTITMIILHSRR